MLSLIIAILLALYAYLALTPHVQHIADNHALDEEMNQAIKEIIGKAVRVQYTRHDQKMLDEIFSREFQQSEEFKGIFQKELFYRLNSDYMQSVTFRENSYIELVVRVYGFILDEHYQIIRIRREHDGSLKVVDIGFDP